MTISVSFSGVSAIVAELEAVKGRIDRATRDATTDSGRRLKELSALHFSGTHAPGFWHVGGANPNIVTGALIASIVTPPAVQTGTARYSTRVGPTAIYSRVIELGAVITPTDHKYLSWFDAQYGVQRFKESVTIPPRPYFTPAFLELPPFMEHIFHDSWERAWVG